MKTTHCKSWAFCQNGASESPPRLSPLTLEEMTTPLQAEFFDQILQLRGGQIGMLQRHVAKSGQPIRMLRASRCDGLVLFLNEHGRQISISPVIVLSRGGTDHLEIHAHGVHVL